MVVLYIYGLTARHDHSFWIHPIASSSMSEHCKVPQMTCCWHSFEGEQLMRDLLRQSQTLTEKTESPFVYRSSGSRGRRRPDSICAVPVRRSWNRGSSPERVNTGMKIAIAGLKAMPGIGQLSSPASVSARDPNHAAPKSPSSIDFSSNEGLKGKTRLPIHSVVSDLSPE